MKQKKKYWWKSNFEFKNNIFAFENFSPIKKIALTSLFASIGIIFKLIEIPTFSSFLKLDLALIPSLIMVMFVTYPYIIGCVLLIDLISLRGTVFGWLASLFFSISLINGTFLFYTLINKKIENKIIAYNLGFMLGLLLTTLFLYVTNTYFITPAFFGMSYAEISSKETWENFSNVFFSISNYKTAMFLFYSAFNFFLKGMTLFILINLISLSLFFRRKKEMVGKIKTYFIKKIKIKVANINE